MRISMAARCLLGILLAAGAFTGPAAATGGPAARLVIPVVANKQGALGTFFRTDVTLTNHRDVDQTVAIRFYATGEFYYGDPKYEGVHFLPAKTTVTYLDIVATAFAGVSTGNDALGTIVLEGLITGRAGGFDPDARLDATYRIWTVQPGGTGTMSQSSTELDMQSLPSGTTPRVVIGVRQDENFRCNVGIFTSTYGDRNFLVTASSPRGSTSMNVRATGTTLTQVPLPPANLGYITVTIQPLDALDEDVWTAYASSVDNRSGDSWLQNAAP